MVNNMEVGKKLAEDFLHNKVDKNRFVDWAFKASDGFIYHFTDGSEQKQGENNSIDPYIKVLPNGTILFTSPVRDSEAFNKVRQENLVRFKK